MLFETKSSLRQHAAIRRTPLRPALRGPWAHLLDQVMALGEGRGELLRHAERPWASATFSGSRHAIALAFADGPAMAAAENLIAALPDHEFDVPGHLVADAAVVAVEQCLAPVPTLTVELEVLLLEDL